MPTTPAPDTTPDDLLAWVTRLLAEASALRIARWDAEYPPGHADREAMRPAVSD